jgi:hypothetical protein
MVGVDFGEIAAVFESRFQNFREFEVFYHLSAGLAGIRSKSSHKKRSGSNGLIFSPDCVKERAGEKKYEKRNFEIVDCFVGFRFERDRLFERAFFIRFKYDDGSESEAGGRGARRNSAGNPADDAAECRAGQIQPRSQGVFC